MSERVKCTHKHYLRTASADATITDPESIRPSIPFYRTTIPSWSRFTDDEIIQHVVTFLAVLPRRCPECPGGGAD